MPDFAAFWDKRAASYDAQSVRQKGPNYAARLARAGEVWGPGDHVLDIGCASGEITLDLAGRVGSIHGIDVSAKLIALARAKAAQRGVTDVRFDVLDAADPSLAPESYDGITAYSVMHLVADVAGFAQRAHALLKPGGHFISETPCLGDWGWYWGLVIPLVRAVGMAPPVVHRLRHREVEAILADAGFEILDSRIYNARSGQHHILARKAASR